MNVEIQELEKNQKWVVVDLPKEKDMLVVNEC